MTNWRIYGPITRATFVQELQRAHSPMLAEVDRILAAAGDQSALMAAMAWHESKYGTAFNANVPENLNPLNLRPRGGAGFLAFVSFADCVAEWRSRLLDPQYVYHGSVTLADLIHIYAPSSDNNNEAEYVAAIVAKFDQWGISPKETPVPTQQTIVFGRVPKPPIIEMICPKPYEGAGFYRVAPRQNVGVCEHITDGHGSIEFYHAFFSTGGERATDALVDFVVGRDGRIGMLNDWRGTRAPWANGTTDGLEGDGPAFINRFGIGAVNSRLVSIEHEGLASEDWTGAQWNASVALVAALFDAFGVRYDSFPVHQQYGVVTHLLHSEFTGKGGNALDECPGRYLKRNISAYQTAIKAVMMAHQVVATQSPPPPPPDVTPAPEPFDRKKFDHGLDTKTDQYHEGIRYAIQDRVLTVRKGRKVPKYTKPGGKRVAWLTEKTKIQAAYIADIDGKEWVLDHDGYWYNRSGFTPKVVMPLPLK